MVKKSENSTRRRSKVRPQSTKLEFSSKDWSKNRGAGHFQLDEKRGSGHRPSRYFYFDDNEWRRAVTGRVSCQVAENDAKAYARSVSGKLKPGLFNNVVRHPRVIIKLPQTNFSNG